MKRLFSDQYREIARTAVIVLLIGVLMVGALIYVDRISGFISQVLSAMMPFFIGGALAFIQLPIAKWLESVLAGTLYRRKPKARTLRLLSSLLSLLLLIALISLFVQILLPQIISSVGSLVRQITTFVNENNDQVNSVLKQLGFIDAQADPLNTAWQNLLSTMTTYVDVLPTILRTSYNVVYSFIFRLFIGLITSFYLLADRDRIVRAAKRILFASIRRDRYDVLTAWISRANGIFAGFTTGKIVDSIIIGVLCYLGMLVMQLEYAVLISVVIGITNILPFFGPFIGAIPSILILLIINPSSALKFGIFILVLQQVDGNIIGPRILGNYVGMSPLLTMVSIILGSSLFGFVGMLLGVPICALLYTIIHTVVDTRLAGRELPPGLNPPKEKPPRSIIHRKQKA